MIKKSWTLTPEENSETGDLVITFPEDLLAQAGWAVGDVIEWTDLGNGSWQLTKKLILVEVTPEEEEAWSELDKQLKEKQHDNNQ